MKKKIAIVTQNLKMGGIEKVLIEMIKNMSEKEYKIDLYVMSKQGELLNKVPSRVNIINMYGDENRTIEKIINKIKRLKFFSAFRVAFYSLIALKFSRYGYNQEKWLGKTIDKIEEKYDIAIAYHVPASFCVIFVHDYLKAKIKVGWIHSDMSVYKNRMINYFKYYNKFDKVYCISKDTKSKFLEVYPNLKEKVDIFYNLVDTKEIIKLSNKEGFQDKDFNGVRILTVGRLCEEKNQIIIPEILQKLLADNYNIKWYLIGEGEKRAQLVQKIKEKKMEGKIILLGNKNNPYPYFKECDIYVQTSNFEGYCTTITEAKLFNNPIVATNFTSIHEQIKHNITGIITENNTESVYEGIKKILDNKSLRAKISKNLTKEKTNKKNKKIRFL